MIITTGAAGKTAMLGRVASDGRGGVGLVFEPVGDTIDVTGNPAVVDSVEAGDEIRVDNSRFLALQTYHRHQFRQQARLRLPRRLRLLPQPRRFAEIPTTSGGHRRGRYSRRHRSDPDGLLQRQDDRGRVPARWRRAAVAGRLVPEEGRGRRGATSRGEVSALVRRQCESHEPTTEAQQTHTVAYSGTVRAGATRARRMGRARHRAAAHQPIRCRTARCSCRRRRRNARASSP